MRPMSRRPNRRKSILAAVIIGMAGIVGTGTAARAETAGDIAVRHLYAGTHQAGLDALAALPDDAERRFGAGILHFVAAIEGLGQDFYRHGLDTPRRVMIPLFRLPVPQNPAPVPLTYDKLRMILDDFRTDLAAAESVLASVGGERVKLAVNPGRVRIDLDGDGNVAEGDQLWALYQRLMRIRQRQPAPADFAIAFDTGDAAWLAGYSRVMMAVVDFLLAHDFSDLYDSSFHVLFPTAKAAFVEALRNHGSGTDDYQAIADVISLIHNIRWPVVEPDRMSRARQHLLQVVAHSRASWKAILAEADNDREWIPNPKQQGVMPQMVVTDAMVTSWAAVMDHAEALLEGRALVPHWRFTRGVNLKRVFEEPGLFDMVLWFTGPAAVPYLDDGPTVSSQDWDRVTEAFGRNFFAYVVWFN